MMTVKEVSCLTGVSVRTLQYYDQIGLLHPGTRTEAGYRLYDAATLETLQQILLFRELKFSLVKRDRRDPAKPALRPGKGAGTANRAADPPKTASGKPHHSRGKHPTNRRKCYGFYRI